MNKQEINELFNILINTLDLIFLNEFYTDTLELKKVRKKINEWYNSFKRSGTLININPEDVKFLDIEVTNFFDKYIESEPVSHNYTEILSFNFGQLEKYWKDELIERKDRKYYEKA